MAYLVRPPGWVAMAEAAVAAVTAERDAGASQQSLEQVAHLRRQLESAAEELKQTRQIARGAACDPYTEPVLAALGVK